MAQAEDYSSRSGHIGLNFDSQSPGSADEGEFRKPFSPQLERAAVCEENAQRLSKLLEQLEAPICCIKLVHNASLAIEQLLSDAARLLEQGRHQSNPLARKALAEAYRATIDQIDGIASDAEFEGLNYAAGDVLKVAFDSDGEDTLRMDNLALTSASLELLTRNIDLAADANIIGEMMRTEEALNTVRLRRTFIDMASSVLNSRAVFLQNKVQSLHDTSQELTQDGRAHLAIQETAAQRIAMDTVKIPITQRARQKPPNNEGRLFEKDNAKKNKPAKISIKHLKYNDNNITGAKAPDKPAGSENGDIQNLIDDLDTEKLSDLNLLAMDLARFLDEEGYFRQWLKFENGDTDRFVTHLANSYGKEIVEKAKEKYAAEKKFKSNADQFMRIYEKLLEKKVANDPDPKAKMDSFLKTNYGTLYIILTRAAGTI